MLDLKRCPFCGARPSLVNRTCLEFTDQEEEDIWDVACGTRDCYLEHGADWYAEQASVVMMWNQRAAPQAAEVNARD